MPTRDIEVGRPWCLLTPAAHSDNHDDGTAVTAGWVLRRRSNRPVADGAAGRGRLHVRLSFIS